MKVNKRLSLLIKEQIKREAYRLTTHVAKQLIENVSRGAVKVYALTSDEVILAYMSSVDNVQICLFSWLMKRLVIESFAALVTQL